MLHEYDSVVAAALLAILALFFWRTYQSNPSTHRAVILIAGGLFTGFFGVQAELWGISNGYWVYHDLSDGRDFARWIPFAWALAFVFLYRIEEFLFNHLNLHSLKSKLLLVAPLSGLLPAWGEMVAINFGAWSYSWGYQFFGIPILTVVLLTVFHVCVFLTLTFICRKYQIDDNVYGSHIGR